MRAEDINPEGFVRGPDNCICGPLYHYGGHVEPGQFHPECPYHSLGEPALAPAPVPPVAEGKA
jgi:hypothetical protein